MLRRSCQERDACRWAEPERERERESERETERERGSKHFKQHCETGKHMSNNPLIDPFIYDQHSAGLQMTVSELLRANLFSSDLVARGIHHQSERREGSGGLVVLTGAMISTSINHSVMLLRLVRVRINTMQCDAMRCNAMRCNAMQCNTIQYNTIYQYFTDP